MRVDFEKIEIAGSNIELWAASVTHQGVEFRVNITQSHNPLPAMAYVFEIAEGDGYYTDVIAKGFGPDAVTAMKRSVNKCREIAVAHNMEAPIACPPEAFEAPVVTSPEDLIEAVIEAHEAAGTPVITVLTEVEDLDASVMAAATLSQSALVEAAGHAQAMNK